ncbi:MAG: GNAT family N-acetyltransferase [Clostridia bacterium]|nr:GNAT family N-acetyltransferase [Clostridia bacterium]
MSRSCGQPLFIVLNSDFISSRLSEYVWEEDGNIPALLSVGKTADIDKAGAFEVWRIYVSKEAQGKGISSSLLSLAEQQAKDSAFHEIIIWAFRDNIHDISL